MPLEDIIREWQEKSEQDINSAKFLCKMIPLPVKIIGFHCQQAIEKLLKAIFVKNELTPPKSHDILFLIGELQEDMLPVDISDLAVRLKPFAVD